MRQLARRAVSSLHEHELRRCLAVMVLVELEERSTTVASSALRQSWKALSAGAGSTSCSSGPGAIAAQSPANGGHAVVEELVVGRLAVNRLAIELSGGRGGLGEGAVLARDQRVVPAPTEAPEPCCRPPGFAGRGRPGGRGRRRGARRPRSELRIRSSPRRHRRRRAAIIANDRIDRWDVATPPSSRCLSVSRVTCADAVASANGGR